MSYRQVDVFYTKGKSEYFVGTLATTGNTTVFEYDSSWAKRGIELAPIKLPVEKRSHVLKSGDSVSSTFGLFADSLPDGWGTLIMDRWLLGCTERLPFTSMMVPLLKPKWFGNDLLSMRSPPYHSTEDGI
jgi:hypothetical protein